MVSLDVKCKHGMRGDEDISLLNLDRDSRVMPISGEHKNPGEGGFFTKFCTWMCLPDFEILTFAIFCPHLPPINIQILHKKQPLLLKLGAFCLLKYTQFI